MVRAIPPEPFLVFIVASTIPSALPSKDKEDTEEDRDPELPQDAILEGLSMFESWVSPARTSREEFGSNPIPLYLLLDYLKTLWVPSVYES